MRTPCLAWLAIAACSYPDPRPAIDGGLDPDTPSSIDAGPDANELVTPMLLAVTPSIANTGATIVLEGTFGSSVTVHFPGGVDVPATTVGPHRSTVVVPVGATAGSLAITSAGVRAGDVPFRRASFTLGLQPFQEAYAQTHGGMQTPRLQQGRANATAIVVRDRLYVVGGGGANGIAPRLESARINADGTLGPFTDSRDLVIPRYAPAVVTVGSWLYVIGGEDSGAIERAPIAADGSLGAFTATGQTLAMPQSGATVHVVGDHVVVIGGNGPTGVTGAIQRAPILEDGSLGAFTLTGSLITPRGLHTSAVVGGWLYVLGGADGPPVTTIERAPIGTDGMVGAFSVVPGRTITRTQAQAIVLGDSLYVVGGTYQTAGGELEIQRTTIAADGSLGAFTTSTSTLSTRRNAPAIAIVGNSVHVIGGANGQYLATIEHAQIGSVMALGNFENVSGSVLPNPRIRSMAAVIGNHLYILGGHDATTVFRTVERAPIAADGSLGTFVTAGNLVAGRANAQSAVVGNFLYVIGGMELDGTPVTTIERATIAADGTLGAFSVVSGLTLDRLNGHAIVLANQLYILAGSASTTIGGTNAIVRSTIAANGSLGAFSTVSATLATKRNEPAIGVLRGAVILAGGANGSYVGTTERATFAVDGTLASFATGSSMVTPVASLSSVVVGGFYYLLGGGNFDGVRNEVTRASVGSTSTPGSFAAAGVALDRPRENSEAIVLGNHCYLVYGGDGTLLTTTIARAPIL